MLLIPTLGRQKQVDLCEFKASMVYTELEISQGLHSEAYTWASLQGINRLPKSQRKQNRTSFIALYGRHTERMPLCLNVLTSRDSSYFPTWPPHLPA